MTVILFILSFGTWADPVILDEASVLQESARQQLLQQQISEFGRRLQTVRNDCQALLADLPGPDNTRQPLSESHTFIATTMQAIKNEVPTGCQRQLAQNLMTSDNPVGHRLAREILLSSIPLMASDMMFCGARSTSPIQDILGLANSFQTNQGCNDLGPNQWNLVNRSAAFYDTLSYAIQRIGNQENPRKYRAVLNLDFVTSSGASVDSAQMLARVRQCLNGVQPYLNGPVNSGDGSLSAGSNNRPSTLQIDVISGNEALQLPASVRPRRNTVRIAPSGTRNTVRSFAEDVSCDTIVHEVMHLLGLCDEYPGEPEGFPCRPVGRPTGLMRNEALAFASTIPMKLTCDCSSPLCQELTRTSVTRNYAFQPGLTDYLSTDFRVRYCNGNQVIRQGQSVELAAQMRPQRFVSRASGGAMNIEYSEIEAAGSSLQVVTRSLSCRCPTLPDGSTDPECQERISVLTNETSRAALVRNTMTCPASSTALSATPQAPNASGSSGVRTVQGRRVIELFSTPQQTTLFEPRHLNQIVNGNCREERLMRAFGTAFYNDCTQLSYQRSLTACSRQLDGTNSRNRACLDRYNWGQPCSIYYGGESLLSQDKLSADYGYTQNNSTNLNCRPR